MKAEARRYLEAIATACMLAPENSDAAIVLEDLLENECETFGAVAEVIEEGISDGLSSVEYPENACTKCGAPTDDGEGYDGLCGNCADKTEESR